MDKNDSPGGMPNGGLVMIVLLAAGAFFVAVKPLQTGRPVLAEQRSERHEAVQDVEARLWQDPLAVVARARQQEPDSPPTADELQKHDVALLRDDLDAERDAEIVVLAVMIPGGIYAEQIEGRLRMRYAVLAGLAGRNYVPSDNEHLGYFYLKPPCEDNKKPNKKPDVVPFERFQCGGVKYCKGKRVVLLWLDSSVYVDQPLHKLAALARAVTPVREESDERRIRWRVLGPQSSDGLRAFAIEADLDGFRFNKDNPMPFDMRFFSGAATVSDDIVLKDRREGKKSVTDWFLMHGVPLLRTIGTDDDLGGALVHELELRGLHCGDKNGALKPCPASAGSKADALSDTAAVRSTVAIVAEWDTLYGRKLQQLFSFDREKQIAGFSVEGWYYLRGLDGRLPGDRAPAKASGAEKDAKEGGQDAIGGDGTFIERPEGRSQFDYLRRLATRIGERDAALRKAQPKGGGIRAVGVLGNDVYDKLLVLQALQSELPHAIFFTTDLDARLLLPSEQEWARNLIVASNFGLSLVDSLQNGFPPFRDSYQTSVYFSTLLALDKDSLASNSSADILGQTDQVKRWFKAPRVFEVSRSGFFDFSAAGPADLSGCKRWQPFQSSCVAIHPPSSPMAPDLTKAAVSLIAAPLMLALWVPALVISRGAKRRLRRFIAGGGASPGWRRLRKGSLLVAGLALAVLPPMVLAWQWQEIAAWITHSGKPLSLTKGISPWPTYAIRLVTLVVCLYLAAWAWAALARNVQQISCDFRLGVMRRHLHARITEERRGLSLSQRFASMMSVRFYRERPVRLPSWFKMSQATVSFWKHYIVQNRFKARLLRTFLCLLVMMGFAFLVLRAFGEVPASPQRGGLTSAMQPWTTRLAVPSIQFLIFFVADATLLSVLFIRGLRLHKVNWPDPTREVFFRMTGVPEQYLDEWIDLQFIARRSRVVGRLIYFPFIALSLMLAARSSFFDDWNTPPALYVIATLSFGIMLACAIALRMTAEASRSHAVETMRDASLRARGLGNDALVGQLDVLRGRMEQLDEGAFAPFSRQPLLRAVLLPLLTIGGSSLFDYLALLNV
ncbi:MAG: hypothetical protein DVS81_04685 [Candidatus Accumulibacter meliphilus]|jgi:hypothetical protein|uniref:Uncharacterized protein n=1 Tax=Candidatus Accumulibacter meliphilus TaxID=2211374 RepID=A0A369XQM1_9PROT|nr:MAG: hypothetical protein DVS81_04685 [Candidatus Accumulibacter meliphilus]